MDWFRWHHGTVDDPKFTVIARRAKQPRIYVVALWALVMEFASTRADRGAITDFDSEIAAASLDVDVGVVDSIMAAFKDKELIVNDRLKSWLKRQPKREDETGAERKKKWKERQKQQLDADGTHGNAEEQKETPGTCKSRAEQSRAEQIKPITHNSNNAREENERAYRACFDENEKRLKEIFPDADFIAEKETCIAHYRDGPPPLDPYPVVMKWFNKAPKGGKGYGGRVAGGSRATGTKAQTRESGFSPPADRSAEDIIGDFPDHSAEWLTKDAVSG